MRIEFFGKLVSKKNDVLITLGATGTHPLQGVYVGFLSILSQLSLNSTLIYITILIGIVEKNLELGHIFA